LCPAENHEQIILLQGRLSFANTGLILTVPSLRNVSQLLPYITSNLHQFRLPGKNKQAETEKNAGIYNYNSFSMTDNKY